MVIEQLVHSIIEMAYLEQLECFCVLFMVIKFKVLDAGHMKVIYYGINGWTENR